MNHVIIDTDMGRSLKLVNAMPANKVLFTAELLVLSEKDTVKVNETDLKYYTFKYNDAQDCLVLGDGELFNHSDDPNVGYKLMDWAGNGRKVMVFYTLRHITSGEELFIDYGADADVDVKSYTVNLVG